MEKKKYYIEIYYETGDSNGNYDMTSDIGITWDNIDIAKANLKRIKEHYEWHQSKYKYFWDDKKNKKVKKPKFVDSQFDQCFNMITDDGKEFRISAYWCGHFENLYTARIKENEDPDLIYRP